jgi:hypothetical protein
VETKRVLLSYGEVLQYIARHSVRFPVWLKPQGGDQSKAELCRDEDDLVPYADLFFDDDPDTPLEVWHADVACQ